MRDDGSPPSLRAALRAGRHELTIYLAAGAVYVAAGAAFPEVLFSWLVGAGYLLLCVVVLPGLGRRLRS